MNWSLTPDKLRVSYFRVLFLHWTIKATQLLRKLPTHIKSIVIFPPWTPVWAAWFDGLSKKVHQLPVSQHILPSLYNFLQTKRGRAQFWLPADADVLLKLPSVWQKKKQASHQFLLRCYPNLAGIVVANREEVSAPFVTSQREKYVSPKARLHANKSGRMFRLRSKL